MRTIGNRLPCGHEGLIVALFFCMAFGLVMRVIVHIQIEPNVFFKIVGTPTVLRPDPSPLDFFIVAVMDEEDAGGYSCSYLNHVPCQSTRFR